MRIGGKRPATPLTETSTPAPTSTNSEADTLSLCHYWLKMMSTIAIHRVFF